MEIPFLTGMVVGGFLGLIVGLFLHFWVYWLE